MTQIAEEEKEKLKAMLDVSDSKHQEIEKNTRRQVECSEWFKERNMRLTSSNFGAVIKRRKQMYPKSLLNNIQKSSMGKRPFACKWGKDNESAATKKYCEWKGEMKERVRVCSSCGLFVNRNHPCLGASRDLVLCDDQENSPFGIGEIKSPYSKKDMTVVEACKDKNFCMEVKDGRPTLENNHIYFFQVQGAMATLHLQWADFIVYIRKDLYVERIYFDKDLWEEIMFPELTNFYFTYIWPLIK